MKIIFFGTPLFAASVLTYLIKQGVEVQAVVSKPDKAIGRSKKLVPTPVKSVALEYQIPLFQPEKVSAKEEAEKLKSFEADLFVVVGYGEIIKQHVLDMPKKGCINLHTSLLPRYRGAAPIQRAIINGENEVGVTIMHMVKAMDAGDMINQEKIAVAANETYGEVQERLCGLGSSLLLKTIQEIDKGEDKRIPQEESLVTFAPKMLLEECEIDWSSPAVKIHNLVRGANPAPGAWCVVRVKGERKRLKIHLTEVVEGMSLNPKELLHKKKEGLFVGTGEGTLQVKELQLEGKKRMSSEDLLRGISFSEIELN